MLVVAQVASELSCAATQDWNILFSTMETVLRWLAEHIPYEKLGRLIQRVLLRRKLVALAGCLFLAGAAFLLTKYYQRSRDYGDIVNATLHAKLEPTPQRYKGLESFILSKVDNTAAPIIEASTISDDFVRSYDVLIGKLKAPQAAARQAQRQAATSSSLENAPPGSLNRNSSSGTTKETDQLLHPAAGTKNGAIMTDSGKPGFLFLPLYLIQSGYSLLAEAQTDSEKLAADANRLLDKDDYLKRDVLMTRQIAEPLQLMLGTRFVSRNDDAYPVDVQPAQVYLVTSTGLNRIFSNSLADATSADLYYSTQFAPTIYFPGRPYYQGAINEDHPHIPLGGVENSAPAPPQGELRVGNYFYVSRPYMDLGGNGTVVTASRLLTSYQNSAIVLCLDFRFKPIDNLSNILTHTITQFEADRVRVRFEMNTETHYIRDPEILEPADKRLNTVQEHLIEHAKAFIQYQKLNPSAFFGNIQQIDESSTRSYGNSGPASTKTSAIVQTDQADAPLEVSIPIGNVKVDSKTQSAEFLLFGLDLHKYRHVTDLIGLAGCTCLGLFSILLVGAISITVERNDDLVEANADLHKAFAEIGQVLWEAPIPYVLLNVDDTIKDCNQAFFKFLKYPDAESVINKKKFRDCIAPDDQFKYDEVQRRRKDNEVVDPYPLRLCAANEEILDQRWVVSAAVPSATSTVGRFPETFGVFLTSRPSPRKITPINVGRMPPSKPAASASG
jgi:PAS domain-containing protein